MVFLYEVRMRLCRICADAENNGAFLFELRVFIAKSASFFRATGRRIFRVEVENDVLAAKTGQGNNSAVTRRRSKIGRDVAFLQFHLDWLAHRSLRSRTHALVFAGANVPASRANPGVFAVHRLAGALAPQMKLLALCSSFWTRSGMRAQLP